MGSTFEPLALIINASKGLQIVLQSDQHLLQLR
jgi:hypothetical protein